MNEIMPRNIVGMYNAFAACTAAKVKRLAFSAIADTATPTPARPRRCAFQSGVTRLTTGPCLGGGVFGAGCAWLRRRAEPRERPAIAASCQITTALPSHCETKHYMKGEEDATTL